MTIKELKAMTSLLMCSDPWPCEKHELETIENMVNAASVNLGYTDWVDAYHLLGWEKSAA